MRGREKLILVFVFLVVNVVLESRIKTELMDGGKKFDWISAEGNGNGTMEKAIMKRSKIHPKD